MHNTLQGKHPNLSVNKIPRVFGIDRMPDTNDVDKHYPDINTFRCNRHVCYSTLQKDKDTYLRALKIDNQN